MPAHVHAAEKRHDSSLANVMGGKLAPIGEEHLQLARTVDDEAVGEDVAVGRLPCISM